MDAPEEIDRLALRDAAHLRAQQSAMSADTRSSAGRFDRGVSRPSIYLVGPTPGLINTEVRRALDR